MFDYQGYSAETLERLCDQRRAFKGLYQRIYGQVEGYSIGHYYREEAGYPQTLPLYIFSQHGANQLVTASSYETETDAEAMLVWNTERQREYQKLSDTPCYVVTCPYISRRRRRGLVKDSVARGTLIFPAHSTKETEIVFDMDAYITDILALPAEFQPVAVCLHTYDVRRGSHRRYQERGLSVYTAGDVSDVYFGDRLYEILRHFRYTMSNFVGSYAFYSVEMGIPFSVWGEEANYGKQKSQSNEGSLNVLEAAAKQAELELAERMFTGFHTKVSREQKEFVEFYLGIGQGISREELGKILWEAYRKRGHPISDALVTARLRVKYALNRLRYGILD